MSSFPDDLRSLLVDTVIFENHYTGRNQSSTRETQFQGMSEDITGCVLLSVEIRGERSAQVSHADLYRHAGASFVASGKVVGEPGDVSCEPRVNSHGGYEDTGVHDTRTATGDAPGTIKVSRVPLRDPKSRTYKMNPIMIKSVHPMTNGLLLPTRSEKYAVTTARMAAVIYIGTVRSCAVDET